MNSLVAACDLKAMHTPCASLLSNRTQYRKGRKKERGSREEVAGSAYREKWERERTLQRTKGVEGVEGSLENRLTVAVVLLKNGFHFSTI